MDSYLYTMQIIDLRGNRPQDKQYMVKNDVHYNFFAFFWVILIKTCRKFLQLALDIIKRFFLSDHVDPALIKYSFSKGRSLQSYLKLQFTTKILFVVMGQNWHCGEISRGHYQARDRQQATIRR